MKKNNSEYDTTNDRIASDDPHALKTIPYLIGTIILLFVLGVGTALWYYIEHMAVSTTDRDVRETELTDVIPVFEKNDDAITYFQQRVDTAQTLDEEGQAKFNLAFVQKAEDRALGIATLKDVAVNDDYSPIIRAKAANYVINDYTATHDADFARKNIFTGPVWGDFIDEGDPSLGEEVILGRAVINAFQYSFDLYPTPEAVTRLAAELAFDFSTLPTQQQDDRAERIFSLIEQADLLLEDLIDSNQIGSGEIQVSELSVAFNRKAKALDVLYFYNYLDDPQKVITAYEDATNVFLEYGESRIGTELFARYHYADFLLRLDSASYENSIEKILAPMNQMEPEFNIAQFFKRRIEQTEDDLRVYDMAHPDNLGVNAMARPDNIRRLAQISPEFHYALVEVAGIAPGKLELE